MDSFLLGNGRLGATVRGGIATEEIDINLDRLWSGGPQVPPDWPSSAALLPEIRAAIRAGADAAADALARQMQGRGWTQSFQPLATLQFHHAPASLATAPLKDYGRHLDLATATAHHAYRSETGAVALRSFVCSHEQVAVTLAEGDGLLPPDAMALEWQCAHPATTDRWREGDQVWTRIQGRVPSLVVPLYVDVPASAAVTYATEPPGPDGLVDAGMGFCAIAVLAPLPGGGVRVLVAADCGFRGAFARPSADLAALSAVAETQLRAALAAEPSALEARQVADHRAYFDRVDLELPAQPHAGPHDPARAELLYHFGRYLLIASSRPGTEPANLQGIWNPWRRPAWSSNHTTNINTQMNYWPAEPNGLGDLAEPLMTMLAELIEAGRISARHYYGAPGAVVHHNTDLWRFSRPVQGMPVWANWTGALPWLLAHAYDHWDFGSGGDAFARDALLPMLADAARFLLFLLVPDDEGQLILSPSSSPEHCFEGRDGKAYGVTEGAALDQELARQVLERLVALSARFGGDHALTEAARSALERLRPPDRDETGALAEWATLRSGAEPGHRHLSHLYGLYPGDRITEGADLVAARTALDHRLAHGTGHTGWSQAWVLCIAARLGDRTLAGQSLATLLTDLTTRALLVLHPYQGVPGNAVFQIDGNFGATAGVTEMLLQSHRDVIRLLPTLPEGWEQGRFRGLRCRGGHQVSARWSAGRVTEAWIVAGRDGPITIELPAAEGLRLTDATDAADAADGTGESHGLHGDRGLASRAGSALQRQSLSFSALAGRTYRLGISDR